MKMISNGLAALLVLTVESGKCSSLLTHLRGTDEVPSVNVGVNGERSCGAIVTDTCSTGIVVNDRINGIYLYPTMPDTRHAIEVVILAMGGLGATKSKIDDFVIDALVAAPIRVESDNPIAANVTRSAA